MNAEDESIDKDLLALVVCPIDKQPLLYFESKQILYNPRLKKQYEIVDSIPVLLEEKAYDVNEETHQKYIQAESTTTGSV